MSSTLSPSSHLPLHHYLKWAPFRIDALGLVTFLGAEEVNASIGRLVRSRYLEFLPLLGAFVIASNQFTERASGFTLYNISSAIATTDLAGWFTRWISAQKFHKNHSIVEWEITEPRSCRSDTLIAAIIGFICSSGLIVLSVLMSDWWGLANAIAMVWSIGVRYYVLEQNRSGLDKAVTEANQLYKECKPDMVKFFITTSDSKAITMKAPESIVRSCFIEKPSPPNRRTYTLTRHVGWIAFAIHIISIGQADLISQIYTVVLMILPTVFIVYKVGCDDELLGSRLRAKKGVYKEITPEATRRTDIYVWLDLDPGEEDSMKKWMLFPHERNEKWWRGYRQKKANWQEKKKRQREKDGTETPQSSVSAMGKTVHSTLNSV